MEKGKKKTPMTKYLRKYGWAILIIAIVATVITVLYAIDETGDSDNPRDNYNIDYKVAGERYKTKDVFGDLPPMPVDFWKVRILVLTNVIRDLTTYGPEYWKQPEWQPSFSETCLPRLIAGNFPTDMHAAGGYGFFPTRQGWQEPPGSKIVTVTTLRAACFVPLYQGIGLRVAYPESARFMSGTDIWYSDVHKAEKYLKVEHNPKEILIGPAFPVYHNNYSVLIQYNVTIDPSTPPGRYIVALKPGGVSSAFSDAMYKKYLNMYDSTGNKFKVGGATLFIEVKTS